MSIEQHEIELKELLNRIMRDPLQPLQTQLDQTSENVTHIDQQLSTLREVELAGVCARLDGVEKVLKRLRSWAEDDATRDLKSAIIPPVQDALDILGLRIDGHTAMIAQPVQSIYQELAQTATAVERLSKDSVQGKALAVQRDAILGEQVRDLATHQAYQMQLLQAHIKDATSEAVEHLSSMSASANAAQVASLQLLVDTEVSQRIDKLVIQVRWMLGLAIAAVCTAFGCLIFLIQPLKW